MNAMPVIFSAFITEEGQKDPHADTSGEASVLSKTRSTAGFCGKEDRSNSLQNKRGNFCAVHSLQLGRAT